MHTVALLLAANSETDSVKKMSTHVHTTKSIYRYCSKQTGALHKLLHRYGTVLLLSGQQANVLQGDMQ